VWEVLEWWRKESHIFAIEDVERAVAQIPGTIILGTGAYGVAKVTEKAKKFIQRKGIRLVIDKTEEAVKAFNAFFEESLAKGKKQNKVIGLFHLTC